MKVLACTGGIGSGKSYVSRIFSGMGFPVYESDIKAKLLYDTDPSILGRMVELLGRDIVRDGVLQRGVVASRIFNDRELLEQVERIVHPAVVKDFECWKSNIETGSGIIKPPFVVFESAIILEKPVVRSIADKVLVVSAPLDMRIERVMRRDGQTREMILSRISSQWDDKAREAMADFIIFADCKKVLLPQVIAVAEAMANLK